MLVTNFKMFVTVLNVLTNIHYLLTLWRTLLKLYKCVLYKSEKNWAWKYHTFYQNHSQEYLILSHHLIFDYFDFDFLNFLQLNYADCFSCVVVTLKMFQNFSFFLIQLHRPILMISLSVVSINSCLQSDPAACIWLYENGADHVTVEKDNWRMQILIKRQRLKRVTKNDF